jgi:excisionase family DNA binding protein
MTGIEGGPLAYRRPGAAAQLGISTDTLDRLIASGAIRATKVRTATVVTRAELERYLASLSEA